MCNKHAMTKLAETGLPFAFYEFLCNSFAHLFKTVVLRNATVKAPPPCHILPQTSMPHLPLGVT